MGEGRPLVAGEARGPALVLEEPLSFWGGLDPETGRVIDVHHPQLGQLIEDLARAVPQPGRLAHLAQRLPEDVAEKADQDVRVPGRSPS